MKVVLKKYEKKVLVSAKVYNTKEDARKAIRKYKENTLMKDRVKNQIEFRIVR